MKQWNSPISDSEAARRAGGRRKYNKQRQIEAIHRRVAALNLAFYHRLSQAEIARRLGVSRATVCRYMNFRKYHIKTNNGLRFEWPKGWRAYGYWY